MTVAWLIKFVRVATDRMLIIASNLDKISFQRFASTSIMYWLCWSIVASVSSWCECCFQLSAFFLCSSDLSWFKLNVLQGFFPVFKSFLTQLFLFYEKRQQRQKTRSALDLWPGLTPIWLSISALYQWAAWARVLSHPQECVSRSRCHCYRYCHHNQ